MAIKVNINKDIINNFEIFFTVVLLSNCQFNFIFSVSFFNYLYMSFILKNFGKVQISDSQKIIKRYLEIVLLQIYTNIK